MDHKDVIPTYNILKGHSFTNNLKALLGCKDLQEISDITGIPTSTFSTWNNQDRTSADLIVRLHLAFNIPVKDLALGYQRSDNAPNIREKSPVYYTYTTEIGGKTTLVVGTFLLKNGKLTAKRTILLDQDILSDIDTNEVLIIEETNRLLIVDKQITDAVNGRYLVDIDGLLSLNEIQRIPGKKLAITFNHSTLNVKEENITIVGKVIADINRL